MSEGLLGGMLGGESEKKAAATKSCEPWNERKLVAAESRERSLKLGPSTKLVYISRQTVCDPPQPAPDRLARATGGARVDQPKYRAFLSYSHRDAKWADWLHKRLEGYRPPKN